MLEQLKNLIEEEKWEEARKLEQELEKNEEPSDVLSLLNAMIYMAEGDYESALKCITVGIILNPRNYQLYYVLGNYYLNVNINQAYLCYEQALFYCDKEEDSNVLRDSMNFIEGLEGFEVASYSVILQYQPVNDYVKRCIKSLEENVPCKEMIALEDTDDFEQASWMREQNNISVYEYKAGEDGAKAINHAVLMLSPENDILLLRSDSILPQNSIFWLRMGLYDSYYVGAVAPVSNTSFNDQALKVTLGSAEEYMELASQIQIPSDYAYEKKIYLENGVLLSRRTAWEKVGGFEEEYMEPLPKVTDYCIRLGEADFECRLCTNSFVYLTQEYQISDYQSLDWKKLTDKLTVNIFYYIGIRTELIDMIQEEQDSCFSVLEIGCGCGTTLSHIKWQYPNARVCGVELSEKAVALGRNLAELMVGNIETMELPYIQQSFDYILCGDVLEHLHEPEKVIAKLRKYLKPSGKFIACIPNIANITVITPLLHGKFVYKEAGLLDRTHIHFFTRKSIEELFDMCGCRIESIISKKGGEGTDLIQGDEQLINLIYQLPGIASREELETYQYLVVASKM